MTPARKQWLKFYTNTVAVFGIAILFLSLLRLPADVLGVVIFATLSALAQLMDVELFSNARARVSVSVVAAIASILLFGPLAGALTHCVSGIAGAISTSARSRRTDQGRASNFQRSAFNIGMLAAASAAAGLMYGALGGQFGQVMLWSNLPALLVAASVDVLVNLAILIGVISIQTGNRPGKIWKEFQWSVPITIGSSIFGGGLLAIAYQEFQLVGVAVFFLPILAISYSFRLYIKNTSVYMKKLEEMNVQLEQSNQQLNRSNQRLESTNIGLLSTLGAVIDAYDIFTYGHSRQVSVYAVALAEMIGLPPEQQASIRKAALVHDIGKVGVMDSILGKRGKLTADEYSLVKRHPVLSADILERMDELHDLVPLVRHHHERWDGSGYPDGLAGEEIPLGSRILAVADAVDAIISSRTYRETFGVPEMVAEIKRCTGSQFDPGVVAVFLELVAERGEGFFQNSAVAVEDNLRSMGISPEVLSGRYMKKSMVEREKVEIRRLGGK